MNEQSFAFRCGWCGTPCDADGTPRYDEDPKTAHEVRQITGWCCPERFMDAAEDPEMEDWEVE